MRPSAIRTLAVASILAGLLGCQSAPRWAWWKRDTAPEEKSLVARSAAPALPSTQATPQAVELPAPPSSANLAAAGTGTGSPSLAVAAPSAATIASAPVASYPSAGGSSSPYSSPTASASGSIAGGAASIASSQAGPYDPAAYQSPGFSSVAGPASAESGPSVDRYAMPDRYAAAGSHAAADQHASVDRYEMPNHPAATEADRYASPQVAPYAAPVDRYAMPSAEANLSTGQVAANVAGSEPAAAAPSMVGGDDRFGAPSTDRYATATTLPAAPAAPPAGSLSSAAVRTATTVELTAPAGQYRPGGTSSYVGSGTTGHVEIASRPDSKPVDPGTATTSPRPSPSAGPAEPLSPLPTTPPPPSIPSYRAY